MLSLSFRTILNYKSILFQHMFSWHTLEQRQAAGIKEDLVTKPTRRSEKKKCTSMARGRVCNQEFTTTPLSLLAKKRQTRRSGIFKTYVCKQCEFISNSKEEQWVHIRTHIPREKQLRCTECQFITKHKHHLAYHRKTHFNYKPFSCTTCKYTCVSNSSLNSHMKYTFF